LLTGRNGCEAAYRPCGLELKIQIGIKSSSCQVVDFWAAIPAKLVYF